MKFVESNLFGRLIERSPFSFSELAVLIFTAPQRYKEHTIKKRSGGLRLIAQPTKEVKFLQRLLVEVELKNLKVSTAATAYVKGSTIKEHAQRHAGNRYLLKLDFRDFFPSITQDAIDMLLTQQTDLSPEDRFVAKQILLRARRPEKILRLSIGAPSSPSICNWVMYEFDEKLLDFCRAKQITYSRYADDMAFSTNQPRALDEAQLFVQTLLGEMSYLGLSLNAEKTINVSKKHKRALTGLVLANDGKVSIGREKKRLTRAKVHSMITGKLNNEASDALKGYLSFLHSIDPVFVSGLADRYNMAVKDLLTLTIDRNHNDKS